MACLCLLANAVPSLAEDAGELVFVGGDERLAVRPDSLEEVAQADAGRLHLKLSREDAAAFAGMTERLVGQRITLSWCGVVLAAPTVTAPISDGALLLTADETQGEAIYGALSTGGGCPEDQGQ